MNGKPGRNIGFPRLITAKLIVFFFSVLTVLSIVYVLYVDFVPTVFGEYSDQRIFLALSIVVITSTISLFLSMRQRLGAALLSLLPFSFFFATLFIALIQGGEYDYSATEPGLYILYFLAFGFTGHVLGAHGLAKDAGIIFIYIISLAMFFYSGMTITLYTYAILDDYSRLDQILPWGFVNIRYWSHVATWLIPLLPLALLVGSWQHHRLWRILIIFSAAVWWWLVFLSSSRGTMAGVICGSLFVLILFGRGALPWAKSLLKFAGFGVLVWLTLSVLVPNLVFEQVQIRGLKAHSSGRWPLWQEAWMMSLQNLPFGMGPQSWLTHSIFTSEYRSASKVAHPHNMYLMWAAEYGWISILGFSALCGLALKRMINTVLAVRLNNESDIKWLVGFTASIVAVLVHAGVSAVFIAPGSMLIGLFVLSIFWALIEPFGRSQNVPGRLMLWQQALVRLAFVSLFVVLSLTWFKGVLNYHRAMVEDFPYYKEEVGMGHLPRFWFHGYFPRHPVQMPN